MKARIERFNSYTKRWEKESVGSNYHTHIVFNHHITTWPEFEYALYSDSGLLHAYHVADVPKYRSGTLPKKLDFFGNAENDKYPYYDKYLIVNASKLIN